MATENFNTTVNGVYVECVMDWEHPEPSTGSPGYCEVYEVKVRGVDITPLLDDALLDLIVEQFKNQPSDDD